MALNTNNSTDIENGILDIRLAKPPMSLTIPSSYEGQPVSPKSPGSMYSKTAIEDTPNGLISSIVLCYWDNILGPRVRHLWHTPVAEGPVVSSDVLHHIASHTLSGEICRDPTDCHVDTKFFLVKEGGFMVNAFVFGALGPSDFGVHSLASVMRQESMSRCLQLQSLLTQWMTRGVARLRVLMEKNGEEGLNIFTSFLSEFTQMLRSLEESGLPAVVSDCDIDTAFQTGTECKFEKSFLCRAITSHLMTCGCSVVTGENASLVNMMIATLGMFLGANDRRCSRFVLYGNKACPYAPGLFLQGFLQSAFGELTTSLKNIHLSQYPTSLIDLRSQDVKFSALPHHHQMMRHEAIKQLLTNLWHGKEDNSFMNDMFHSFDEPETLVTNLVEEWSMLPPNVRLQEAYISQFMQYLDRRAMSLIRYVEAETPSSLCTPFMLDIHLSKVGQAMQTHSVLSQHNGINNCWNIKESNYGKNASKLSMKRLRQDLSLKVPGDFYVVLATAEKLKPGMFYFVASDNKGNTTDQALLMDSF